MEPARRIELRLPPYRGGVLPLPLNRRVAGRPGFEPEISRVKAERVCRFPHRPSRAPTRCYPGLAVLTRNVWTLVPGARVPGAIRTRTADLLGIVTPAAWSTRTREPPPGVEPGRPLYEGGAASRARRRGYRGWNRTSVLLFQRQGGMPATHPVMVRKVRKVRFERTYREVWAREVSPVAV